MKKLIIGLGLIMGASFAQAQHGLENVLVEKYYVSNAADATGSIGTLPTGSVTYRIYADMLPGYKFQALYGVSGHALNISTSTSFFNNEDRGATTPNAISKTNASHNSVMLDSWFSTGAACAANLGILKSEDNGVSTVVNTNGILANNNASAGIPLTTQDGLIAGTIQAVSFVGLTTELDVFDASSNAGNSFTTSNGSIACLVGSTGPTSSNRVLVGQFTTNGNFHFDLNIQIGTPTGGSQNYVAHNPVGTEISIPSLTFDNVIAAPTASPVSFCLHAAAAPLTATALAGDTLKWYTTATGGIGSLTAPTPTTTAVGTQTYYVSQYKTVPSYGVIESARTAVVVTVNSSVASGTPGTITGPTNVCTYVSAGTASYTIASVLNATSYNWTVPATGATIMSGQGTTAITIAYTSAYTTGVISVKSVSSCGSSTARTLTVSKTLPGTPSTITGLTDVCSNVAASSNVTYSIAAVTNATSYNWTVPANATIVSGQGTNSIVVSFSSAYTTGSVSVQAVSNCGSSAFKALAVTKKIPSAPGAITGPANVCSNVSSATNATYSIAAIAGANSYNWTVPATASIVSGQGTTSIVVSFLSTYTTGSVSVQSVVPCGASAFKALIVTKTIPATPGAISGAVNVCSNVATTTNAVYTIVPVNGAASYNWTVPATASIVSGQGTTSITVSFTSAFLTGSVSVQSVVACGASAFRALAVKKTIPAAPGLVSGPVNVCSNVSTLTPAAYSIAAVSGADSYNWTVPANSTIVSGQGTTAISVLFSSAFVTGSVSVQSVVACGASAFKTLTVKKTIPAAPLSITGATSVCADRVAGTPVTYSVVAVSGADSYTWTAPAHASIVSGQGTTSVGVLFDNAFLTGNVSVQSTVACGSSTARTLTVKTAPILVAPITGNSSVCGEITSGTPLSYSVAPVSTATTYNWTVPTGAVINSGAGTTNIHVTFAPSTLSGTVVKVTAANACGASSALTLALTTCHSPIFIQNTEEDDASAFSSIYPQPAADYFNLDVNSTTDKDIEILVFDVQGKKIIDQKHSIGIGANTVKTDFNDYNKGIYFVQIVDLSTNAVETRKLIK